MGPIRAVGCILGVVLLLLGTGCGSDGTGAGPAPAGGPASSAPPPAANAAGRALSGGARAYVDAVNAGDLDALVAAFAPDGQVVDVSRRIAGRDAIREWADGEVIGGSLRVDGVTPIGPDVQRVRVHWAPAGSGGWAADYTFTDRDGQVVVADLQYAS
jgi:hypothetical protein